MKNIYDELLKKGLSDFKTLEFSYIPEKDELDYILSSKYIKKKEKLLKKISHSYWKYINTATKKVAAVIVALIISFSSLMVVDAFREKVVGFIYKIYSTFTIVSSINQEAHTRIENYYIPKNIPEGYTKYFTNNQTTKKSSIYWINNQGNYIMLTQIKTTEYQQFNSEYGLISEKLINNTPCLVCVDNNLYYCYWEFDSYRFELIYPLDLGEEFMSEVVGNLVEIDPAELES